MRRVAFVGALTLFGLLVSTAQAVDPPVSSDSYYVPPAHSTLATLVPVPKAALTPVRAYDPAVTGIEVSQGVAAYSSDGVLPYTAYPGAGLPVNYNTALKPTNGGPGAPVPYSGVSLEAGRLTRVRVHLAEVGPRSQEKVAIVLHGYDSTGKQVPGSPMFSPGLVTARATGSPFPQYYDRVTDDPAADFYLPPSWTHAGMLTLDAKIVGLADGPVIPCTTPKCQQDDRFVLRGIPFFDAAAITVQPLQVVSDPAKRLPEGKLHAIIDAGTEPWPGGTKIRYLPSALLPVTTTSGIRTRCASFKGGPVNKQCFADQAFAAVKDWMWANQPGFGQGTQLQGYRLPYDALIALDVEEAGKGASYGGITSGIGRIGTVEPRIFYTTVSTSPGARETIAHEYGHVLARPHASTGCNATGSQKGEAWPPDQRGHLQGVALPLGAAKGVGLDGYDIMSYCNDGALGVRSWVGPANWQRTLLPLALVRHNLPGGSVITGGLTPFGAASASDQQTRGLRASGGRSTVVEGIVAEGRLQATSVSVGAEPPPGPVGARVMMQPLDAAGAPLPGPQIPAYVDPLHDHLDDDRFSFSAVIPDEAASAALYVDGAYAATITRSPHAPTVSGLVVRVARDGRVKAGWQWADVDHDQLVAAVDASIDGGRTWRTAIQGLNTTTATLPPETFLDARSAMVRVRVQDSTNEASVASTPVRVSPAPTPIALTLPLARRLQTTTFDQLALRARASDALGAPIRGMRMTWKIDGRVVDHGESALLAPLTRGVHRLEVVAAGSTLARRIHVTPGVPTVRSVSAPRVGGHARSVRVRVATVAPATLATTSGARRVDARVRSYRVPITRGATGCARPAALLRLSAASRTARVVHGLRVAGNPAAVTRACLRAHARR